MRQLISAEAIAARVRELGAAITRDFASSGELVLVPLLRGSLCFAADLMRAIDRPVRVDFLGLHSYAGSEGGEVRLSADMLDHVAGADVLIVEDIIERGTTLSCAYDLVTKRGARSVHVCALLRKPSARALAIPVRYVGFEIGPEFVIGYGLDHDQRFRNLPFVAIPDSDDLGDERRLPP